MGQVFVYEPWPTAVDTMGLCGPLTPTKAVCTQEKNGDFRLDIEHPIDEAGKWAKLVPGNLIKADVPLRSVPIIQDGALAEYIYPYRVKDVARASRGVSVGGVRVATLDVGTIVYRSDYEIYTSSYRVRWPGGEGYMASSSLTNAGLDPYEIRVTSPTTDTIEQYIPSPRSRMQLFRINEVRVSEKGVSVSARHVFYDPLGEMINYAVTSVDPPTALPMIKSQHVAGGSDLSYNKRYYETNLSGTKSVAGWKYVSPIEAIMAPNSGVLSLWGGEILRDNWGATLLTSAGMDRGYSIEYARNLKGVDFSADYSEIITCLLPIGQTSKGKPLYVIEGIYSTSYGSISLAGNTIASPHNEDYAVPHIAALDKGSEIKAAGTSAAQVLAARIKLIEAALDKFAQEQCDLPQITLNVDFIHLGDTAEYAQYWDLQKLFLYDTVRVKHPRLGIDVTAQVNKTVWDCMLDMYVSVEIGSVRKNYARSRLAGWQIPGLASLQAYVDTISSLI